MKKLDELIYNQRVMVKELNKATEKKDIIFFQKCVDEYELEIEKARKELGLR